MTKLRIPRLFDVGDLVRVESGVGIGDLAYVEEVKNFDSKGPSMKAYCIVRFFCGNKTLPVHTIRLALISKAKRG